ncbi:MAG: methyltransferase domain-containing protein [Oscillospiraceae bacterium]|nr:methyltransferase domain-containing protein [Oscillospiraceae bacterium]
MSQIDQTNSFGTLAKYYDELNAGADYKKVADYIEQLFGHCQKKPETVLDLACGTGNLALELEARGYDLTALDLSSDMLALATSKKSGGNIFWTNQDMCDFELYGTVDAAVCCFDSLNYVCDEAALKKCFALVNNYLNPGGIFVFDVNSKYMFERVYDRNAYIIESPKKNVFCAWQNRYDKKTGLCDFYLTIFARQPNGAYLRCEEAQREKYHSGEFLKAALLEAGFCEISVCYNFSPEDRCEKNEKIEGDKKRRICFAAKKNNKEEYVCK